MNSLRKMVRNRKQMTKNHPALYMLGLAVLIVAALVAPQVFSSISVSHSRVSAATLPYMVDLTTVPQQATTVPAPYAPGVFLSGGNGVSGTVPGNEWTFTIDLVFDPTAGNAPDNRWVQIETAPGFWDLSTPTSSVFLFPSVDHGPVPYEGVESTVWGSNDPNATFPDNWTLGTLTRIYNEGQVDYMTARESDDYASLWTFPGTFRYIAVYANGSIQLSPQPVLIPGPPTNDNDNCPDPTKWCSDDAEIDAIARPTGSLPQLPPIQVALDVHPTSCPNPINTNSKGVIPAAILGTASFDVNCINISTIRLEGVAPLRTSFEDVATPFSPFIGRTMKNDCNTLGADGFLDLTLKFDTQAIVAALGALSDKQLKVLHLTANLKPECGGGAVIFGEDVVVILKKKELTV